MSVTLQAHDMIMAALALLGVILAAGGALALLVRVLGRKAPDVLEEAARLLLVEAAGLRARTERKQQLAKSQPRLELIPAAAAAVEGGK